MYFALPCDALLVSPPANLAAGNTNIRNKDKQNLSSKQIPAESETRHVQGVLLLAQLCSHLSRKDNRTTSNTRASQLAAWACLLVTVLSLYRLISCHDGISGFTNLQMCTVSAFDPDFSCKLVLQKIQAYTDPYLPTHRFKMRYANRNFKTPKAHQSPQTKGIATRSGGSAKSDVCRCQICDVAWGLSRRTSPDLVPAVVLARSKHRRWKPQC